MLERLPLFSSLHVAFSSAESIVKVKELPLSYNGHFLFELPPCGEGSIMQGMEHRHDAHVWTSYKTCTVESFKGIVRMSKCGGHLRCYNVECSYCERTGAVNETQWKGKLHNSPSIGPILPANGTLVCKHCGEPPECISTCNAYIYYCTPHQRKNISRCAIHVGVHDHPIGSGVSRAAEQNIESKVAFKAQMNPNASCKNIEVAVTKDLIMEMLVCAEGEPLEEFYRLG